MENYVTIQEIADRWNLSPRRVQYLCKTNRISGAQKVGDVWLIPADARKPADLRKKKDVEEPAFPVDDFGYRDIVWARYPTNSGMRWLQRLSNTAWKWHRRSNKV